MKKLILLLQVVSLMLPAALNAETVKKATAERFWGKVTSLDTAKKAITLHNRKKNVDERFNWNEQTEFVAKKQQIQPTELKDGQVLMVSYEKAGEVNMAKRVVVMNPFKKNKS